MSWHPQSNGPCMCGAPDCPSCGPAQGYTICPYCKRHDCEDPELCRDRHESQEIDAYEAKQEEARDERNS